MMTQYLQGINGSGMQEKVCHHLYKGRSSICFFLLNKKLCLNEKLSVEELHKQ